METMIVDEAAAQIPVTATMTMLKERTSCYKEQTELAIDLSTPTMDKTAPSEQTLTANSTSHMKDIGAIVKEPRKSSSDVKKKRGAAAATQKDSSADFASKPDQTCQPSHREPDGRLASSVHRPKDDRVQLTSTPYRRTIGDETIRRHRSRSPTDNRNESRRYVTVQEFRDFQMRKGQRHC